MKKILMLGLIALSLTSIAGITVPSVKLGETKWWQERKGLEVINWVDHYGKVNTATRMVGSQDVVKSNNGRQCSIKISPDLKILEYNVSSGYRADTNDLSKVAPATYDVEGGKFYTQLADEEKQSLWVAYETEQAERKAREEAERNAPAKFDVSRTPEEFKADLLGDRSVDDLTKEERIEYRREVAKYTREWNRINRPELEIAPMPDMSNRRGRVKRTRRVVK